LIGIGFLIKVEKWDSEFASFSLFMAMDPIKGITCGVIHMLVKQNLGDFRVRLEALKQVAWNPILLPTILVELRMAKIPLSLTQVRNEVYKIEKTLGTHKNYRHLATHTEWGYYSRGEEVWNREGFEESAGELTSLAADCALFESKCQINLRLLAWIQEMNNLLSPKFIGQSNSLNADPNTAMDGKIEFMRSGLENNIIRSVYLGQRAQVQVQAVSSALNIKP
jgi:hypothetical protein